MAKTLNMIHFLSLVPLPNFCNDLGVHFFIDSTIHLFKNRFAVRICPLRPVLCQWHHHYGQNTNQCIWPTLLLKQTNGKGGACLDGIIVNLPQHPTLVQRAGNVIPSFNQ